jgi:hypothetical protein
MDRQTETCHPSSVMASTNGLLVLEVEIDALIRAERVTLKKEQTFMRFLLLLLAGTLLAVAVLGLLGGETLIADAWFG